MSFSIEEVSRDISQWLKDYLEESRLSTFVVGVSGGVDSAVVSTLCAQTGAPLVVLNIPINSKAENTGLSTAHCDWLEANYDNVSVHTVDMGDVYNSFKNTALQVIDVNGLALANTKSRLRMVLLYYFATTLKGLVIGTGNKVEDFGVGFYTKYGDGGVDVSPIADLTKTQVRALAQNLGILTQIIEAPPTDGLWEDSRTDEEQIGASYEELEWAMDYVDHERDHQLSSRQQEVLDIFLNYRTKNAHKMNPIPVYAYKGE